MERQSVGAGGRDDDCRRQLEIYRLIFDHIHNGVIVTDAAGYVTHFNRPYGRFLGIDPAAQIGRHVTEVIENTRMHIVARSGVSEINVAHRIKGQDMVVQRIPIVRDGEVIAVFGQVMFKDVKDVGRLAGKLSLLESKVRLYEQEIMSLRNTRFTFDSIIAASEGMKRLKLEALRAAATSLPVLITGESGTGKEMFAQAIHHASSRRLAPFVRINCAAIPRDLLEAELFGYERGAFTGAHAGKPGKFELADRGSIFLDEIGEMPLEMQPKLLRVLEEKEFERLGGVKIKRSDFRVIAATNQDLLERVRMGRFREDLYYRLTTLPLHVPPLRERRDDIMSILTRLLELQADEMGRTDASIRFTAAATAAMEQYVWPGNVREVANLCGRLLSAGAGPEVDLDELPGHIRPAAESAPASRNPGLREVLAAAEKQALKRALVQAGNNRTRAAELLGIHRTLLYKKMQRHDIDRNAGGNLAADAAGTDS
ncbi:MAG: sigma 54-interacting transcriptional regulator [Deltaproteobacteria bacterium]|nr:sigma 54-interacting transcriptional regulator [Candidatus Anaeroferrophillacea bacterium]